jgi:hypothetical protein
MADKKRGAVLTILAILFVLIALSNFLKPLSGGRGHFVFLGMKQSGIANAILGPLFGLMQLVIAAGIWRMKRYTIGLGYAYTGYVVLNTILFNIRNPQPWDVKLIVFWFIYIAIGVGVPLATAMIMSRRRDELT